MTFGISLSEIKSAVDIKRSYREIWVYWIHYQYNKYLVSTQYKI